jgi:hypothetical protein
MRGRHPWAVGLRRLENSQDVSFAFPPQAYFLLVTLRRAAPILDPSFSGEMSSKLSGRGAYRRVSSVSYTLHTIRSLPSFPTQ